MDPVTMLACELDPSLMLSRLGFDPLPWQVQLLRSTAPKISLNAHRQAGKSSATGCLALWTAMFDPGSLTLLVSASLRQSQELFLKVKGYHKALGEPIPATEDNAVTLRLATGSRIVSLPDSIDTIVGYSGPRLIIIDEASRTKDETYLGLRPMLARSRGRLICMSTPRGKRGWWYEAWIDRLSQWERIEYPVTENPHIDPVWLEEERRGLGPRWYGQDYLCQFNETIDQVFTEESIDSAFECDEAPMIAGGALL